MLTEPVADGELLAEPLPDGLSDPEALGVIVADCVLRKDIVMDRVKTRVADAVLVKAAVLVGSIVRVREIRPLRVLLTLGSGLRVMLGESDPEAVTRIVGLAWAERVREPEAVVVRV